MTALLDAPSDRFATVMGADRGIATVSALERLTAETDQLIRGLMEGDPEPLFGVLRAHRRDREHPAVQRLLDAAAEDLADDVWSAWTDGSDAPLRYAQYIMHNEDRGRSPWLRQQTISRGQTRSHIIHIADLRPGLPPVSLHNSRTTHAPQVLCHAQSHAQSSWDAAGRGTWRNPSRIRAKRCPHCKNQLDTLGMTDADPALTERTGHFPHLSFHSEGRHALTQVARGALLDAAHEQALAALHAAARDQVKTMLADTCLDDPLPVAWHSVRSRARQNGACEDPLRGVPLPDAQQALGAVDWHALWDAYLPAVPGTRGPQDRVDAVASYHRDLDSRLAALVR